MPSTTRQAISHASGFPVTSELTPCEGKQKIKKEKKKGEKKHVWINTTCDAFKLAIKAGGCSCSRSNFIGAYFAALKGVDTIPNNWIKKTLPALKILKQK